MVSDLSFLEDLKELENLDLTAINPDDKKVFMELMSLKELDVTDSSLSRADVVKIMIWLKDCHVKSSFIITDEELNRGKEEEDTDSQSDKDSTDSEKDINDDETSSTLDNNYYEEDSEEYEYYYEDNNNDNNYNDYDDGYNDYDDGYDDYLYY